MPASVARPVTPSWLVGASASGLDSSKGGSSKGGGSAGSGPEAAYGPRERLLELGPDALTDLELLAVCLRCGSGGQSVLSLAQQLLQRFNGLGGLLAAAPAQLLQIPGLGPAKAAALLGARALAQRMAMSQLQEGETLSTSAAVLRYLRLALGSRQQEVFGCLFLDARHRLLCFDELFFGSVDRANVYPREVLKRALTHNAAAVILAHNHPSGVPEPSSSDIGLTQQLTTLLAQVDVRVLDHVVVAAGRGVSMAERGLL